jgi:hypothetical protein
VYGELGGDEHNAMAWLAQEWMMNLGGFPSASSRSSPPHFSTQNVGVPPPPPFRPLAFKAEAETEEVNLT